MSRRHLLLSVLLLSAASMIGASLLRAFGITSVIGYGLPDLGQSLPDIFAGGPLAVGDCIINPSPGQTTPSAFEIIYYRANGVLVSETGTPAVQSSLAGRSYVEIGGAVNTGIAIMNANSSPVTVSFYFTDAATGTDFGSDSFTVDPRIQIAAFLNQPPFNAAGSFTGTFTFTATQPVAVLPLRGLVNGRGDFVMSAESVAPLGASTGMVTLPQFADGGGWKTSVQLINTTDQLISGSVQFFSEGSNSASAVPVAIKVNGATGTLFSYTIAPHSSVHLDTAGTSTSIQSGSVVVSPAGGSMAPFAEASLTIVRNAVTVAQVSIPVQPSASAFRVPVQVSSGFVKAVAGSALAITNTAATPTSVTIELFNGNTGLTTSLRTTLVVPPLGHIARFVIEIFPQLTGSVAGSSPGFFRGMARITSTAPVVMTALRTEYSERADFLMSLTPPSNETATPSTLRAIFPHVALSGILSPVSASSDGYSEEFAIFSGTTGQATQGSFGCSKQDGQPWEVFVVGP